MDSYQAIAFERDGRILKIILNRPDALNAVNATLHEELARVFSDAAADEGCDVIILSGAGRCFSAGGDLDFLRAGHEDPAVFARTVEQAKRIIFSILDCPKPIIAKVNGHAMGLGATLALFCDVIFMAETARIGDPHVLMGLVAGDGGAVIWPQLIGFARAKECLMTGDHITASEAARMGLVNHAVPAGDLDAAVDAFARRLAQGATKAISWSKVSVNITLRQIAQAVLDASLAYEALSAAMPDHGEAIAAFEGKRQPDFSMRR